jgi:signal transduction histidine kinase
MGAAVKPVILVVDDEARNRALLRGYLAGSYTLLEADSGMAALRVLEREAVDLVLLDVMMPEQDGFETCRLIKATPREGLLPVILVTALGEQDDRNAGLEAGADDFLHKPLDRRELLLRVRSFLRLREQEKLIRAQVHELRRLQSLKDDLVSLLVHDLRNPLAGLISSVELARDTPSNAEQHEDLTRALRAANGLREVLDETLQVRLLEENAIVARRVQIDLRELVQGAIETLEGTARRRKVKVEATFEGEEVAAIDGKLVRRSVENLLSNALKYTPAGTDICIIARNHLGWIEIEVGDRGTGVPDDLKTTMFEKFGSIEAKRGSARRGIGLGLYLVKLVAGAHEGDVSVGDRKGGGAMFRLRLAPDLHAASMDLVAK